MENNKNVPRAVITIIILAAAIGGYIYYTKDRDISPEADMQENISESTTDGTNTTDTTDNTNTTNSINTTTTSGAKSTTPKNTTSQTQPQGSLGIKAEPTVTYIQPTSETSRFFVTDSDTGANVSNPEFNMDGFKYEGINHFLAYAHTLPSGTKKVTVHAPNYIYLTTTMNFPANLTNMTINLKSVNNFR